MPSTKWIIEYGYHAKSPFTWRKVCYTWYHAEQFTRALRLNGTSYRMWQEDV